MQKTLLTTTGLKKLQTELHQLKTTDRPAVIAAISSARDLGDLSENAEYHAAKERQRFLEARIADLEMLVATAEVVDIATLSGQRVIFGATVLLVDDNTDEEKTYTVVGEEEADISKGLISYTSPVGRALIGKQAGDSVEVITPAGVRSYEVLNVAFKPI